MILKTKWIIAISIILLSLSSLTWCQVEVDVNLNIKHSVDSVSDFGRERHIISHTGPTDPDWTGHEDMMHYFFNDLDVYLGRDNGSAGWKCKMVTEDPVRPHWPDVNSVESVGTGLKNWYESSDHIDRHQYENRMGSMIMGTNPYPVYPSIDWGNDGKMNSGWQTYDVDAAAFFNAQYLDKHYAKTPGEIGEPLPAYWECINEPDMAILKPFVMFLSSPEKIFEYHNLSAQEIRNTLGEYAPKIGGMTWGQHDFWASDWINRVDAEVAYYDYSDPAIFPVYDNMWLGGNPTSMRSEGSPIYSRRGDNWWQWDGIFQGFIDECGENMDFYSVHIYDWPFITDSGEDWGTYRTGGHTEAMLDMMEWYDLYKFDARKDIIISEYGSVNGNYLKTLGYKRRDWENLRPFNQMFMQFLERPSHLVLTMPFAPIKATWGDWWNADGSLLQRYEVTMMDPLGTYVAPGIASEGWEWSDIILWYELWSDVDGTRIDTKSSDRDIQVDAYVDGNHMYLILNNLEIDPAEINLNLFDDYENDIVGVKIKHQYLNESLNRPVNDITNMATIPGSVTLAENATMILDCEFTNPVTIDQESKEYKYMSEPLTTSMNSYGSQLCHVTVNAGVEFTANINNVDIPSICEATLRIGMKVWNGVKANIIVNDETIIVGNHSSPVIDLRGRELSRGGHGYWGVIEVDVPAEYLQENNEIKITCPHSSIELSSVQMQVWDFTSEPGRSANGDIINVTGIDLGSPISVMNGQSTALSVSFTPANASQKGITWTSNNPSVATVDEYGMVTAIASSGTATITATSVNNPAAVATKTITAVPYTTTSVTNISINEGATTEVQYYVTTQLNASIEPVDATEQTVVWSSSDESVLEVDPATGKVLGKQLGGTATITASITDSYNGNTEYTASIEVFVGIIGNETIYTEAMVDELIGNDEFTINVPANINGERSITLELIQGESTILGTTTVDVDTLGNVTIPVTITTSLVPPVGSNYKFRATLANGPATIFQGEANVEMLDIIHVDSVMITDWERRVQVGETLPVTAIVYPANAYDTTVSWHSSNTSVATIDANGIVTGLTAGTTLITATANEGGLDKQVTITVQDEEVIEEPTSLIIPEEVYIFPVTTYTYPLGFVPEWTTEHEVTWESSNPSIASVDSYGVVSAGSTEGEVTITATSVSSPTVSATSTLVVSATIFVEAENFVTTGGPYDGFTRSDVGLNNNQLGDWGEYLVNFPVAGDYSIRFYTGAPDVNTDIAVNLYVDGLLHSTTTLSPTGDWEEYESFDATSELTITEGIHTIRIESAGSSDWQWNMEHFEFTFTGLIPCTELVSISTPASLEVGTGGQRNIDLITDPVCQAQAGEFTWTSDNEDIATVDANGTVTGISEGMVNITVESEGINSVTQVIVTEILPSSITITPDEVFLTTGNTVQLTALVQPDYASDKSVSWSSDNTNITVDEDGTIHGTLVGEIATITATSNADNSVTGLATVTIVAEPIELVIEAETLTSTGGTIDDSQWGGPGQAVKIEGAGINWVNSGDWAEYSIDVTTAGEYSITYLISSPNDNAQIQFLLDGSIISTDDVPNNGEWDDYTPLEADNSVTLTEGNHTVRIVASGSNTWQWNLDNIVLLMGTPCDVFDITINQANIGLDVEETTTLTATVNSSGDCNGIVWSSSNNSIATVSESGLVTPLTTGFVTITATSEKDPSISDNVVITITEYQPASFTVDNTSKYLTTDYYSEGTIEVITHFHAETGYAVTDNLGGIQVRLLEMDPDEITVHNVYTFNDVTAIGQESGSSTVVVNLSGVPASEELAEGRYYALLPRFTSSNGSTLQIDNLSPITVLTEPTWVTGVTLNRITDTIKIGETTSLMAMVQPDDATFPEVLWESASPEIASVTNGTVTGNSLGVTTVTVTTVDGNYTATAEITVESVPVEGITLNKVSDTILIGEAITLAALITPDSATNQNITWSSDNESVATVENGLVTGTSAGTAVITVTANDNPTGTVSASCIITIINPNSISDITRTNIEIYPNPVTDKLFIQVRRMVNNDAKATIYNSTGNVVSSITIINDMTIVSTADYQPGIYIIQIVNKNEFKTLRFIKR